MKRRRSRVYEEEPVELNDVLEPNEEEQWDQEEEFVYDQPYDPYDDPYEEYSDEHEAIDHESRFHLAVGVLDLISIGVGIVVILALFAMLTTLIGWLQNDIMHSALLLQSGLI